MNSKYVDQLLKKAFYFEKLAQDNRGNEFWNQPLMPKHKWAFADVADALFENLKKSQMYVQDLDSGTNAEGPGYQLSEMIKAGNMPDPTKFMGLVQGLNSRVQQLPDNDDTKVSKNVSAYLVSYAADLVNYFFHPEQPKDQKQESQQQQQQQPQDDASKYATETVPQFVSRLYSKLRAGQTPSDFDNSKMATVKPNLQRRLNGLNGMATRTPQQEQERQVLQFVLSKV